jgi:hypothetical protein
MTAMGASLNPSAQDYWPRAFARAIAQISAYRDNPALWARFLAVGSPFYHDRWTLVRNFAAALAADRGLCRGVAADPRALERASALLVEGEQRDEVKELAMTARAGLEAARAAAPPASCPGPPGHVRVVVELPRRRFVVEDLVVSTTIETRRPFARGEQLAEYASAVRTVEHVLAARVHPWLCLPGDDPSPVIDTLCLAASPNRIGRVESPEEGHSLGLGLCVAAISHRLGWTLRHDRVVLSGSIDADVEEISLARIERVEYIQSKLEAVIRWLESEAHGHPAEPCDVFIPEDNLGEARPLVTRLKELGARVHPVRTLKQVLELLPVRASADAPVGESVDRVICGLAFVWWGERLVGGEYIPDPVAQAHYSAIVYTAMSALPALLPMLAMAALLRTSVADSVRSGVARIAGLTLVMLIATGAMFAIQWALGAFAFPGDYDRRVGCVVKDSVVVYAGVAALFIIHPLQVQRMGACAWRERRAGKVTGPHWETTRQWADQIRGAGALVQRNIVEVGLVMMAMFAGEFVKSLGGNRWYAPHIAFQIVMPVVIGVLVVHACTLPGADPRPRPYRLRIS